MTIFNFPHTLQTSSAPTFSEVSLLESNYLETTFQRSNTFHLVLYSQFLVCGKSPGNHLNVILIIRSEEKDIK